MFHKTCLFYLDSSIVRIEVSGCTAVVLWGVASRICSKQHVTFFYSSCRPFSPCCFVSVHAVHPYSNIDTTTVWKKSRFFFFYCSNYHMINNLLLAVHAFSWCMLTPLSVDEILLPMYVKFSSNFRSLPLKRWPLFI